MGGWISRRQYTEEQGISRRQYTEEQGAIEKRLSDMSREIAQLRLDLNRVPAQTVSTHQLQMTDLSILGSTPWNDTDSLGKLNSTPIGQ